MQMLDLNEGLIDAVVLRLQQQLPAYCAALNAADTKGVLVATEIDVLDYIPALKELNRFPCVAVQDEPTTLEDDTGFGATAVHGLTIVVYEQSSEQYDLAWMLRRYTRAIASIILDERRIDPAWGVVLDAIIPGPTLSRPEEPREWISYAAVAATFRTEEYSD